MFYGDVLAGSQGCFLLFSFIFCGSSQMQQLLKAGCQSYIFTVLNDAGASIKVAAFSFFCIKVFFSSLVVDLNHLLCQRRTKDEASF